LQKGNRIKSKVFYTTFLQTKRLTKVCEQLSCFSFFEHIILLIVYNSHIYFVIDQQQQPKILESHKPPIPDIPDKTNKLDQFGKPPSQIAQTTTPA
jgi:hypothetical protein